MRPIKFRVYANNEEHQQNNGFYYIEIGYDEITDFYNRILQEYDKQLFTGLLDRNGKEIYEGDIVQVTRTNWYCPGHPKHNTDVVDNYEIYFDEKRNVISKRCIDLSRTNQPPYSSNGPLLDGWNDEMADENIVEIIGNIYKNPELIGK